ncbi:uncharacterized protein BYT42DRAFT_113352 [Radiomyces spectabilis]|uniref:uncharacterized protein n=1 Tax=Radiomyces spectabilis TaxID=64574 RepID=UPI0022206D14|nr:uncharacterized protein BYT42DRAFT_113352 [Radiomyces spectabilis]KAI8369520.1 hypothetical protein BYT42DRAFT_113352 [Radiomyces spectabilis]
MNSPLPLTIPSSFIVTTAMSLKSSHARNLPHSIIIAYRPIYCLATPKQSVSHVLDSSYSEQPMLLIVAADRQHIYHLFWFYVDTKRIRKVDLDNVLDDDITAIAMTKSPFTLIEKSVKEIEAKQNLRHLVTIGRRDGSMTFVLLACENNKVLGRLAETHSRIKGNAAITSIAILSQCGRDKRRGHNDPRIILGTENGIVHSYRLRATLKKEILILPSIDFSAFVRYPNASKEHHISLL